VQANSPATEETLAIEAAPQNTAMLNDSNSRVHSISSSVDAMRRLGRELLLVHEELD
jgi:hypothetical protein